MQWLLDFDWLLTWYDYLILTACTKTRYTGTPRTPWNTGTLRNTGTAEKPQNTELKLTVLFCFPITEHVKNEMSV